ncbi:MAG: hypothetical protein IJD10_02565 [Clostridia bacterium]|nr:hypothetical protein [Clostridia bacterium]
MKLRFLTFVVLLSVLASLFSACRLGSSSDTVTTDTNGESETQSVTEDSTTTAE